MGLFGGGNKSTSNTTTTTNNASAQAQEHAVNVNGGGTVEILDGGAFGQSVELANNALALVDQTYTTAMGWTQHQQEASALFAENVLSEGVSASRSQDSQALEYLVKTGAWTVGILGSLYLLGKLRGR
ncbi:hypothetical protein [uncultured Amphritea sp.]|uniref:hypothetical protein n=1 Tax=uncultured Amphritea sp. TaxID=981605 RepID=UPI00260961D2|nr:hypothetical protein [uncultured Amphritea sp.]